MIPGLYDRTSVSGVGMSVPTDKSYLLLIESLNFLLENIVGKGEGRLMFNPWLSLFFCHLKSMMDLTAIMGMAGGVLISLWIWSIRDNSISIASIFLGCQPVDSTSYTSRKL